MRIFFSIAIVVLSAGLASAQTAAPQPKPQAQSPAPAARTTRAPATVTVTVQITDPAGLPLRDTVITAQGPVSREVTSAASGEARFLNMRAGNYRLRFEREGSITLERDVTVRAGQALLVDVMLNPAPVAPEEPESVAPPPDIPAETLGPPADPAMTRIPDFLERNFIGREARKDSPLGCTSTATATLRQLREALSDQVSDEADEWIYVVAGEGTLRIGEGEQHLQAGTFSLVPHTLQHAILPSGRNPLIVVSVLSGLACQ